MAVRERHHRAATSRGAGRRVAKTAKRPSRTTTTAPTPKAPTVGSRITSSLRSGDRWGKRPSAVSASPSRCSIPVSPRSASTTMNAATGNGQIFAVAHHRPPRANPSARPTSGNQRKARGVGGRAPGNGVRNARAARISGSAVQRQGPPGHYEEYLFGHLRHVLVEGAQRIAELSTGGGGRVHTQTDLFGHDDAVARAFGQGPAQCRTVHGAVH